MAWGIRGIVRMTRWLASVPLLLMLSMGVLVLGGVCGGHWLIEHGQDLRAGDLRFLQAPFEEARLAGQTVIHDIEVVDTGEPDSRPDGGSRPEGYIMLQYASSDVEARTLPPTPLELDTDPFRPLSSGEEVGSE